MTDKDQHVYEILPVVTFDGHTKERHFIEVGRSKAPKAPDTLLIKAICDAFDLMAKNETVDSVRLYHTHPSPGPTRCYVGVVVPEGFSASGRDCWDDQRGA